VFVKKKTERAARGIGHGFGWVDKSLLTKITILIELNEPNPKRIVSFKVLRLVQKKLKSFETFQTFEIHPFQKFCENFN